MQVPLPLRWLSRWLQGLLLAACLRPLRGVPEDVLEESEEEPRMVLKPVLEVVESASRPLVDFSVLNDNLIK
jgi:hypothetical protein